jgi:hypothetical protein
MTTAQRKETTAQTPPARASFIRRKASSRVTFERLIENMLPSWGEGQPLVLPPARSPIIYVVVACIGILGIGMGIGAIVRRRPHR